MKKLAPLVVILLLVAIIVVVVLSVARRQNYVTVHEGNLARVPVAFVPDRFQDTQCGMLLEHVEDSAQAVAPDGKTWFFDDVGCLALWLDDLKHPQDLVLWVHARDAGDWVDGRRAWYTRTAETPMEYGFAAHRDSQPGDVDFAAMTLYMRRGENLTNPYVRKELLGDD